MLRFYLVIPLCVATWVGAAFLAFRYPDETWARRWIGHPFEMGTVLALAVLCAVVAYWPKGHGRCHGCGKKAPKGPHVAGWRVSLRPEVRKVCPSCLAGERQAWWPKSWTTNGYG